MYTYIGATNVISSLGFTTDENFSNLLSYTSGISAVTNSSISETPFLASQIDWTKVQSLAAKRGIAKYTRLEQLLILSIEEIVASSGINPKEETCGFIFSTTKGNIDLLSSKGKLDKKVFLQEMAKNVVSYFGSENDPIVISNACISGVSAIIVGARLIRECAYKHVIVAGGDLLTKFVVSGFMSFKSVSSNPCKPYDAQRDGLSLGEACGSLLLTSDKKLSCGVVLEGGAITNDANHISGPSRTGDGLCYAIEQAMDESNVSVADISFINAHGTATPYNDEMESKAVNMANLQAVYTNSLKPYFGHTLGASGVIETVMCVEQLKQNVAIGTKGFSELGVPQDIIVSAEHQHIDMKRCVKTASGFGGCNGAIVLALEKYANPVKSYERAKYRTVASCVVKDSKLIVNNELIYESSDDFSTFIRSTYKLLSSPNMKFYKMDDLCKLGYIAAEYLLKDKSYEPKEVAVVMANSSSSLDTDIKHQEILDTMKESDASPAIFVYTLPNVVLGEMCIRHKIQGENTFFIGNNGPTFLENYASTVLQRTEYKAAIYGWCDFLKNEFSAELKLIERL